MAIEKDKKLDEFCGCGAVEIQPTMEYSMHDDGDYDEDDGYSQVDPYEDNESHNIIPAQNYSNISCYIKDFEAVTSGGIDSDIMEFCLNFVVNNYSEGKSETYTVRKKISVSKSNLFNQGKMISQATPSQVIESKKSALGKTDLQRMREIAGVPHNKNYI